MNCKIDREGSGSILSISGSATIESAEQLKKALLQALDCSGDITADISGIGEIDLACLQLICSAHHTALGRGKKLVLGPIRPSKVYGAVGSAGYFRKTGCKHGTKDCLWIHADWVRPSGSGGKQNCWEFRGCTGELASGETCPAISAGSLDGVHGGTNAGRACWAVPDTFCSGRAQGKAEAKLEECEKCDFYRNVKNDEQENFISPAELIAKAGGAL